MDMVAVARRELVDTDNRFDSLKEGEKQRVAEVYAARILSSTASGPFSWEDANRFSKTVYDEFGV